MKQYCFGCLVTKKKKKNVEKQDFGASKTNSNIYISRVREFLLSW